MNRPIVAIPFGDPAGIGPEIVVKALADERLRSRCLPLVVADAVSVEAALAMTGSRLLPLPVHGSLDGGRLRRLLSADETALPYLDLDVLAEPVTPGGVSAAAGRAACAYIEAAVRLAVDRTADAVATPPINKASFQAASLPFIGHTELLGELTGTADPLTMFQTKTLRIFFLTRHLSLRDAVAAVTKERIEAMIPRCFAALKQIGIAPGTIAVAALNPHAGEDGRFGDEDVREIRPAVLSLNARGYDVAGPVSADSVFHFASRGRYVAVLSLYHDQGHIAAKMLDFARTVSLTLGLPILRTSVDHGSAYDIAGKNIAAPDSMIEAIRLAADYAPYYRPR